MTSGQTAGVGFETLARVGLRAEITIPPRILVDAQVQWAVIGGEGMSRRTATTGIVAAMTVMALGGRDLMGFEPRPFMEWVTVGDAGNQDDTHGDGYGGVAYVYDIGRHEVTNAQYCAFLNAVAADDTNWLYDNCMASGNYGGIARSGSAGGYTYSTISGRANMPANCVSWYDALRFDYWMHNGQPSGAQDASTTEDGAYDMSLGASVVRKPDALIFLPSEDEWYKAAYCKGSGTAAGYWDYPTQSDTAPTAEGPPGTEFSNGSANYGWAVGVGDLTYVGSYSAKPSTSSYGPFDLGGNLLEWNEADILGDGSRRGVRGGALEGGDGFLRADHRYENRPPHRRHQHRVSCCQTSFLRC